MSGWLMRLRDSFRDPHVDAAAAIHRTNVVKELVNQVASGRPPSPERVREVREILDRDDALVTLFGTPRSHEEKR